MAVRMWFGGVLVVVGVLWLLDAADVLDAGAVSATWWPVAVIGLAVAAAVAQRRFSVGPVVVLVVGVALLLGRLADVDLSAYLWPVVAIVVGGMVLLRLALHRRVGPGPAGAPSASSAGRRPRTAPSTSSAPA